MKRHKKPASVLAGLRRILSRFWPEISQQRSLLLIALTGLLLEIAVRLLEPWPLKFIFDGILAQGETDFSSGQLGTLSLLALAIVGIAALGAGSAYVSRVSMALAATQIMTGIRGRLYAHIQDLSLSFHTRQRSGDLITRVTGDVERLREVTVIAVLPLLVNSLTLVGMMSVMLWLNWQLALISLVVFPLFAITTSRATGKIQSVAREQRQREGAMAATASEVISAIKVVQALSLQRLLHKAFSKENNRSLQEGARAQRLAAGLERSVESLVAVATALVLWWGVQLVVQNHLSPGELLVFINYLKTAFKPMRQLAKYTSQISKATASGERILDLFEEQSEVHESAGAVSAPHFQGRVRFEEVSFGYQPGQRILDRVDFEVAPGQQIAVVGPSGSGKSTLTSLLLRLYDPSQGRILIDEHDIRLYTLDSLRQQISIVLQDSTLFAVSVRDNIAYGCIGATDAEVEAAARLANAHHFISELPKGYQTSLAERGSTLSGGQRQRIAIARAAIRRAPIVVLDEPTTGLDKISEKVVNDALERLTQGKTTFIITHDLRAAQTADQILYLEAGQIRERGTHAELMELNGRYAEQYRTQTGSSHPQECHV